MALSNLRNEPRREITEQVIGMATVAAVLVGDWYLAKIATAASTYASDFYIALFMLPLLGGLAIGLIVMLAIFAHGIGEMVCGLLAEVGVDPRPKNRPGRS